MTDTTIPHEPASSDMNARLPRVAITYCTQCRWLLRAAYFAQELLSTFETTIGEVALLPAKGGVFHIVVTHETDLATMSDPQGNPPTTSQTTIWDRKTDGGFPEAKVLKQRLRDLVQPDRNLGHSDIKPDVQNEAKDATADAVADFAGPAEAAQCRDC